MNQTNFSSPTPVFLGFPASPGEMFDYRSDSNPTIVSGWNDSKLQLNTGDFHFGFIGSGGAMLSCASGTFELSNGMYFAVPDKASVEGTGVGFVSSLIGHRGLFQIGGPVEETGRLRYINGCSDSLLIAPTMLGDPCLNLLHIPPHTDQSAHTHPSLRVGMVIDGEGFCRTPEGDVPLDVGLVFIIHSDGLHSFHTRERSLRIIAWHPDSDFGPTHEVHPMVNRTLVNGRSLNVKGDRR